MLYVQENRLIIVETALPLDDLLLFRLQGVEAISSLFSMKLYLASLNHDLDVRPILGQPAKVRLKLHKGERYFHGIISRIAVVGQDVSYVYFEAELVPWPWLLSRSQDCRVFEKKSVDQIVDKILKDANKGEFDLKSLTAGYEVLEHSVQYKESSFAYISRLLEHYGIQYYLQHEKDKCVLKFADGNDSNALCPDQESVRCDIARDSVDEEGAIWSWLMEEEVGVGKYVVTDYNHQKPKSQMLWPSDAKDVVAPARELEIFEYPGDFQESNAGKIVARLRMEERDCHRRVFRGETTCRGLRPGYRFKLKGHPLAHMNVEFLVVEVDHDIDVSHTYDSRREERDDLYRNRIACIPYSTTFRPKRVTPKPVIRGIQTAVVVAPAKEEIDVKEYASVRVQFHWERKSPDDPLTTCYVRVAQPWAGQGWGSVAVPRKGQEVVVSFVDGNPDRPIILGSVYNADQMAPYGNSGHVSGLKSATHKGAGFNEISMDDSAGKEAITIHAQYDMATSVGHDQSTSVKNNVSVSVDGTLSETIKKDTSVKVTEGKFSQDVVAGTSEFLSQGAVTIKSRAGEITISSDAQHIYIHAATSIQLQVGASKLWMASDGNIALEGTNVVVNGRATLTMKGGVVHSQADSEHQTKGSIVISEGSATNTVKGGMVMLNP